MQTGATFWIGAGRLLWPSGPGAFRLWLALMVVVHHITRIEVGKAPVLVFFALSGYWVRLVWASRYVHCRRPWLTFIISRWWRVAPVTVLASGLSLLVYWGLNHPDWGLIRHDGAVQAVAPFALLGYGQLAIKPLGSAWSLDVEMQFYLVAPLLIGMVGRLSAVSVVALGALCFIWAIGMHWVAVLPVFLIFFLLGLLAAQHAWRVSAAMGGAGMGVALGWLLLCALGPDRHRWLSEGGDLSSFLNLGLGVCLLPFALYSVTGKSDRGDRAMGDSSFLLYLLHWPLILVLRYGPWAESSVLLGGIVIAPLAVYSVWRWYDRPLDRLRASWVKSRILRDNGAGQGAARKKGDTPAHFA
nr:acyltransferase [Novosphingobium sediminicola]